MLQGREPPETKFQVPKSPKDPELGSGLKVSDPPLAVIYLTKEGSIFIWRENINGRQSSSPEKWHEGTITRVIFSIGRQMGIKIFCVNSSSLLLISETGEAYRSGWTPLSPPHLIPYAKDPTAVPDDPYVQRRRGRQSKTPFRRNVPNDIELNRFSYSLLVLLTLTNTNFSVFFFKSHLSFIFT